MKRTLATAALCALVLASTAGAKPGAASADARARADFPALTARASIPGEAVYLARCQYCHLPGGPGTMDLGRRLGENKALLAERTDLTAPYVKAVVRNGLRSMPAITRAEVSDAELDAIAAYLSRRSR